jgi:hypothetical protein
VNFGGSAGFGFGAQEPLGMANSECVKFSRIKKTDTCYQIAWIVSIDIINCIN